MRHPEPEIVHIEPGATHRRDDVRNAVAVQALMQTPSGIAVPCEIVDVSSTGMALELSDATLDTSQQAIKSGMAVSIRFTSSRAGATGETVTARSCVMWSNRRAAGVRFEETDSTLRNALRDLVRDAVEARLQQEQPAHAELSSEQRKILKACRKTLQKHVPNIVWVIRTTLARRLLTGSAEPGGASHEGAAEAAMLESKATAIALSTEHRFISSFADVFGLEQTQELTVAQIREALAQGEAEANAGESDPGRPAEDDRLLLRVVQEVAERHGQRFRTFDKRFAGLLGHALDSKSNPLAPANMCRILWGGLTEHCPSISARQALEMVMLRNAVPLIGELYEALERTLDEQGVE